MDISPLITRVLAHYAINSRPESIESLGAAGGFSGAEFWRLKTADCQQLCLRRWPPEHPTPERLQFIHAVLRHAARNLVDFQLPVPLSTRDGHSFVSLDSSFWELTPWLAGAADFHANSSRNRLQAALRALAQFHVAASDYSHAGPAFSPSPAVFERLQMIRELLDSGWQRMLAKIRSPDWPEFEQRARRLTALFPQLAPAVARELESFAGFRVPLQPCLRDIWHDHVLFTGDEVSGLVDFGAMRIDSVAGDIARLLGSLIGDDTAHWQLGLAAYVAIRPLSEDELRLVSAFDHSSVLLSGMNWLTWICVEKRVFTDRPRVLARLDENLARLEHRIV